MRNYRFILACSLVHTLVTRFLENWLIIDLFIWTYDYQGEVVEWSKALSFFKI